MKDNIFINFIENNHLYKYTIENKEQYYSDLDFIDDSMTGRVDAQVANTFIYEAKYLTINSIKLFELGYFDCAYYSLREAVEMSTTMIYLVDIPISERNNKLNEWKNVKRFPMRSQMIKYLEKNGSVFIDFKLKMKEFFDDAKQYINDINKYVHKQGNDKLYTTKRWYDYTNKLDEKIYINKFEKYLEFTIGYIAMMRLSIDPLPIILMNEDLFLRTYDMITQQYNQDFICKYIGDKYIELYRQTELYKGYEDYFYNMEKQSYTISNIIKEKYVDISKYDEIKRQFHLLADYEKIIVEMFKISNKIADIYFNGYPISYFSNIHSRKRKFYYNLEEVNTYLKMLDNKNIKSNGIYISVFSIKNDKYLVEHNDKLTYEEIEEIMLLNNKEF